MVRCKKEKRLYAINKIFCNIISKCRTGSRGTLLQKERFLFEKESKTGILGINAWPGRAPKGHEPFFSSNFCKGSQYAVKWHTSEGATVNHLVCLMLLSPAMLIMRPGFLIYDWKANPNLLLFLLIKGTPLKVGFKIFNQSITIYGKIQEKLGRIRRAELQWRVQTLHCLQKKQKGGGKHIYVQTCMINLGHLIYR